MRKTANANISQSALLAIRNVYQLGSSLEADVLPIILSYIPHTESNDFFNYLLYSLNETLGKCLKKDKKSNGYHNILCFFQTAIDIPQTTFPIWTAIPSFCHRRPKVLILRSFDWLSKRKQIKYLRVDCFLTSACFRYNSQP